MFKVSFSKQVWGGFLGLPYLFEYKLHACISHTPIFDMKKQDKLFLNIIHSLQSHNKKLKTIEIITAVTVFK